jgi:copper chaperone CopZ
MKKILIAFTFLFFIKAEAQVTKVNLQASGLTCSMCSNAINKALKSLDIVENVKADVSSSTFEITFKPSSAINFDLLKKKVEDAGFFVAKMVVTLNVNQVEVSNDAHVDIDGKMFHFLNTDKKLINGETSFKILDKGFVSAKEFKKNSKLTTMACYQTGYMGSCCKDKNAKSGTRIYHVTIS